MTPNQLADELGISAKTLRAWLRRNWPRSVAERGTEWELTIDQIRAARDRWGSTHLAAMSTDSPPRPYLRENADDLEARARANWEDIKIMSLVAIELFHRQTKRAGSLRAEFVRRIEDLLAQGFPWPTTEAPGGTGGLQLESPSTGMLAFLGYHVGANGLPEDERRAILASVYLEELPPVNSSNYMSDWGQPHTGGRLKKLAETLAALARNEKRKRAASSAIAVDEWEADLEYLRQNYYLGCYDFVWPQT